MSGRRPAEGDLLQRGVAEALDGRIDRLAAEAPVEAAGALIVGERPDDQALDVVAGEIAPDGIEQPPAEADALIFGAQVEFEDLALERQAGGAIAAIGRVAGDDAAEREHHDPRLAVDGMLPPARAAPLDHALEVLARN